MQCTGEGRAQRATGGLRSLYKIDGTESGNHCVTTETASMLRVVLVAVVASVMAVDAMAVAPKQHVLESCGFPNGSDHQIYAYNCDGSWPLMVKNAKVFDGDGNTMYPIDPRKAMVLDLISVNNGVVYKDNHVKVKIHEYSKSWSTGKCAWTELQTFGLLNNIDGCEFAHNCPLQTGDLDLKLKLDLSGFAPIINVLAGDKPYQLEVRMYDYNQGSQHEQIACVVAQIRFSETVNGKK